MRRFIPTALIAVTVAILAAAGTVAAQSAQRFDDVPPDHYAFEAVNWMVDNGITTGCGDGTNFCPGRALNRAHVAAFLYRYHQTRTPEISESGVGETGEGVTTDDVTLEPGYYQVRVWFDEIPGFDWTDDKPRDFYVWLGTKSGGHTVVNTSQTSTPFGYLELRVDEAADYWFIIRVDDEFVWWARAQVSPLPDGVTFD